MITSLVYDRIGLLTKKAEPAEYIFPSAARPSPHWKTRRFPPPPCRGFGLSGGTLLIYILSLIPLTGKLSFAHK